MNVSFLHSMKVGICHGLRLSEHYYGNSVFLPDGYFIADIPVAPEVEHAVELAKPVWSKTSKLPLLWFDKGNHGSDRGLVLRQGICDIVTGPHEDFVKSELVARISFGGTLAKYVKPVEISYESLQRLHIGVRAGRQFYSDGSRGPGAPAGARVLEEVNISLRWLRGKDGKFAYDDWSDLNLWYADAASNHLGKKMFDEVRTTYCQSTQQSPHLRQKDSSEAVAGDVLAEFLKIQRQKTPIIHINEAPGQSRRENDPCNKILNHFLGGERNLAAISYAEVCSELYKFLPESPFGKKRDHLRSDKELQAMTPQQGIDFLFGPVLQGIEKFINT